MQVIISLFNFLNYSEIFIHLLTQGCFCYLSH